MRQAGDVLHGTGVWSGAWAEIRDAKRGRGWVLTDASGLMLDLTAKGESRLGKLCEVIGGDRSRVA